VKLIESKKQSRAARYTKQRLDEAKAQKERDKRDGTYKTAQNLDNLDNIVDNDDAAEQQQQQKSADGAKIPLSKRICPFCKKKGHTTRRSKKLPA
jgi:hypothetical protein